MKDYLVLTMDGKTTGELEKIAKFHKVSCEEEVLTALKWYLKRFKACDTENHIEKRKMIEKYLEQYENTDERIYGFKVLRELFGISRQDAQKYMTDEIVRMRKRYILTLEQSE